VNLTDVIETLVSERGLDKEKIISIVSEGMLAAYNKKFPDIDFVIDFNKKSGELDVFAEKEVVSTVVDDDYEISLRRARTVQPGVALGDTIKVPFEEKIGRIEVLTAKQVIAGKIRDLEQLAVYNEYKEKEGLVVNGVVHKRERAGYAIKIGEILALLPHENAIPHEPLKIGYPIKVLLAEVLQAARGDYQLILDRASTDFVQKLLEVEIPEVFEGLVEVKKIVRTPGYKSKIVVASTSKEIDPVGTCVGVGGARIKPILRELGQEKIDLVEDTDDLERLVRGALKPAEVDIVEIVDKENVIVSLAPDQRSYAIGKMGQNINLASRLVGMKIQLQDIASGQDAESMLEIYEEEVAREEEREADQAE